MLKNIYIGSKLGMKNSINQKWEMIYKSMNEFDIEYHKLASFYNLSDSSFWILYALNENKEGCTQKELYTDWCVNKQTINSSIKYLQNKGYITLQHYVDNKKLKKVCLTKQGKAIIDNTIANVNEIEKRALKKINEEKMDIVIKFLKEQANYFKDEVSGFLEKEKNKNK